MSNQQNTYWLNARADDEEIPAWRRLDIVTRKWANLSGMEKDLENYKKLQEEYR